MNDDCCYKLYMHVNKVNGKVYIGQTKQSYSSRWRNGKGYGNCSRFAKAIKKYGWNDGFEHIPLIEGLSKSEADYFEQFFIEFFDSQNPEFGYNLTTGGDECPMDNPVVRENHREAMKKLSANPEWQKNHSEAMRKLAQDPEWQEKNREAMKKLSANPEWQKNHSEAMKKLHADPYYRETMKKVHANPEWQEKNREALKKVHANPEWQKNHSEALKKMHANPEWQKNHSEALKKMHANPEYQKKHREAMKKLSADPEWQKKNREGAKKRCKKVLCVETKIIYNSLKEAGIVNGVKASDISACCRGKGKTAGGYHWEYA